jgi:hypothetical protein
MLNALSRHSDVYFCLFRCQSEDSGFDCWQYAATEDWHLN